MHYLSLDLGRYFGRFFGLPLHRCRFHRRRTSRLFQWFSSPLTRHHTVLHHPFRSMGQVRTNLGRCILPPCFDHHLLHGSSLPEDGSIPSQVEDQVVPSFRRQHPDRYR